MGENNDIVLEVKNLHKYYGSVQAVKGLSFNIKKGEIYGLLGPNGSGKSTTIKSILGLHAINSGEISVLGLNPMEQSRRVKSNIGYVAEASLIYESMTPRELFNFIASIRRIGGDRINKRLKRYLESLDAMKYYDTVIAALSRGNKQKIQIIAALFHQPSILILDEPLSGLDAKSAHVLKEIFQIHIEKGRSILLSTHIMEHAQSLCTRIGILKDGAIVAEGKFEDLKNLAKSEGDLEDVFLQLTDQVLETSEVIDGLRQDSQL